MKFHGLSYKNVLIALPFSFIFVSESAFFFGNDQVTTLLHMVNIFLCILTPLSSEHSPDVFQAFSLVSILRILTVSVPVFFQYTLYWLLFIYMTMIPAVFFVIDTKELGKQWEYYYLPLGVFIGYGFALVEYNIISVQSLIPQVNVVNFLVLAMVMLFIGFMEEILFRSLLQTRFQRKFGKQEGFLLSVAIFCSMHSGYSSLLYLLFAFLIGVCMGYLFQETRSLCFVGLLHGISNVFLFSLFPNNILLLFPL
ncbi:MAG: CPBP family intramembrane metalloprotease [Candidatus Korarchaeota archaeon]|nr:CPBP family intramembrane metalloprotease [Candidatus Korarchaeota archaeon]NIU84387.1 CPBP family intramembrane metalloprotease [Candidatus Thorarchaeota archaeon]NIW14495.1 CPBP family intramembrane metalloprotease [Candidatus Thorarchaeota archaeon]NIW52575.1 CPBP family intramembrane metalloprotease [Candidatus Korarchaeota archaeon]